MDEARIVRINYTNWKGETADRNIGPPFVLFWGSNNYHQELQWLLQAFDVDKQDTRTFAMKDIHTWTPTERNG